MSEGSSKALATWLQSRVGEPITARSTWSNAGRIRQSSEDTVSVVPLPTPPAKPSGFAATYRSRVTIDGDEWDGEFAVRAELIDSHVSQEKRAVAMRVAHIADLDATAREVLPSPWHTAQTTVPAREVGSFHHGDVTVALDIMQWAEPFEKAFEGLSKQGRMDRAVELAIPLFSGLGHIHRHHRMVHRDIHPDNVMLATDHLIFIDWGISSAVTTGTSTVTQAVGKWDSPYPAPEARVDQSVGDGQQIGSYADVWAMGALLCLMACGHEPVLRNYRTGQIELPAAAGNLPQWLRDIIAGLTQFDRQNRMRLEDAVTALRDAGRTAIAVGDPDDAAAFSSETTTPTTTASNGPAERRVLAQGLLADGYAHSRAGRHADALADFAGAVETCAADADPTLRLYLAMALNNTQWTHHQLRHYTEAVATCSRVVDTFKNDADPALRQQVAIAFTGSGYSKRALGLPEAAVADWDQVVRDFGNDPDLGLRQQVAMALRDKGLALSDLDRRVDALSAYTRLIESFDGDPDPVLRRQVAMALNNKRWCLYWLGHYAESVAACTRLVENFGSDRDPLVRGEVVIALLSKGLILDRLREPEGALAAYGRLVDIFADDPDPGVQRSVVWAREKLRTR